MHTRMSKTTIQIIINDVLLLTHNVCRFGLCVSIRLKKKQTTYISIVYEQYVLENEDLAFAMSGYVYVRLRICQTMTGANK